MKHVVIDLEMNPMSGKKKYVDKALARINESNTDPIRATELFGICNNETIEIGAVMLDDDLQEVSSFRTYVKPEFSEGIKENIQVTYRAL